MSFHIARPDEPDSSPLEEEDDPHSPSVHQGCLSILQASYAGMSRSQQKIADYVLRHPAEVMYLSITQFAERADVGEATVSRFCQQLGFRGFQEMKMKLAQDVAPAATPLAGPPPDGRLSNLTRYVAGRSMKVIEDTAILLDPQELERAIELLTRARRIDFYGIGASGLTALDAQNKFVRIGKLCHTFIDAHVQAMSASLLTPKDVAVAFSHSGSTKEVVRTLALAKERGAGTICVTSLPRSPITKAADVVLLAAVGESTLVSTLHSKIAHLFIVELLVDGCIQRMGQSAREAIELTTAAVLDRMY